MKKLFIFAAALTLTFSSCGNKTQNNPANADSTAVGDTTAEEETAAEPSAESKATADNLTAELQKAIASKNPTAAISTLANLQTVYKNLVDQGKLDDAKAYGSAIKKFVSDNAEAIKTAASGNTTVESLINGIVNLPTTAATTAEQAKAAVTADAVNLASPIIAKGETAVADAKAAAEIVKAAPSAVKEAAENAAKTAVSNAKADAEQKATDAVNNAKAKADAAASAASQKANEAVNAEKQKAADKINEGKQKANEAVNKAANKALEKLLK